MTNKTTSAIDLVLSRIGEEFDGECHLSETEARQIADTITRLQAALEPLLQMIDRPIVGSGADWRDKLDGHAANIRSILSSVGGE